MKEEGNTNGLKFQVKRSRRKTLGITIERDGSLVVRAPEKMRFPEIQRIVSDKSVWIYQKLAKKENIYHEKPKREFAPGQGFLYQGRSYRLKFIENSEGKQLRLRQGYFELARNERENARKHFADWYREKLKEQLRGRVVRYDQRLGVMAKDVKVSDLGHRWASCSHNGTLYFNWRSAMAPIGVFDYVLVHEMTHLIERSHTKKFWSLVSRVIPDYEERIRWLRQHGPDLDI